MEDTEANVLKMCRAPFEGVGMDIVIICAAAAQQAAFWLQRLNETKGKLLKAEALVMAVWEDWPNGAGNGLGTLYAYQQACSKAKAEWGIDIAQRLEAGASVAIYHTAGKGKRLSPLTFSENCDKPAIKLPGFIELHNPTHFLTILEAVIKQTAIYAPAQAGRLSVFWGDQIFIPSTSCDFSPKHHIEILAKLIAFPEEKEWKTQNYDKYGLIALEKNGKTYQVDKCSYETIQHMIKEGKISIEGGVGLSLGSFSLSTTVLKALLQEFSSELAQKSAKMDCEPFFWMPGCLDAETYLDIMQTKNITLDVAVQHYARMQHFFKALENCSQHLGASPIGCVDAGQSSYWWDYGTIQTYYANVMKLLEKNHEADIMRTFFNLTASEPCAQALTIDKQSCLINCQIDSGIIENSILLGVKAHSVHISHSLVMNSSMPQLTGCNCLVYNVVDEAGLCMDQQSIRADALIPSTGEHVALHSHLSYNGEKDWNVRLPSNRYSYEELYQRIQSLKDE